MSPADCIRRLPWSIVALGVLLLLAGLAGIARCDELAGVAGGWQRQGVWAVLSLMAMAMAAWPNYRVLARWSYPALALALVLLALVLFFPAINGARRWIRLGPVSLQASEFAKVAFIFAVSQWLMDRRHVRSLAALCAPLALCIPPMVLILKEPDLGTALLFPPVALAMLWAAGARGRDLAVVGLLGLALTPILWSQMSREQRSRITAVFESTTPGVRPSDDAWHLYQSKQMLALGGASGSWLAGDALEDPAAYQLPAAKTDFIYSVLGERFGLWGTLGIAAVYVALAARGLAVAASTREPFGRLAVVGIITLITVQALLNMAMTIGLAPIAGTALPLVSYGGSNLLSTSVALGLVLNVGLRPGFDVSNEPFQYADGTRQARSPWMRLGSRAALAR